MELYFSKAIFKKNLVGPGVANTRSTASGGESFRQGKDGASWYGNEGKEGRKLRILQKQKSNKICQLPPFSHHYYQYHYPLKKLPVTILTEVLLNCVHKMPKNRKKKNKQTKTPVKATIKSVKRKQYAGLPGGTVVRNPPANRNKDTDVENGLEDTSGMGRVNWDKVRE